MLSPCQLFAAATTTAALSSLTHCQLREIDTKCQCNEEFRPSHAALARQGHMCAQRCSRCPVHRPKRRVSFMHQFEYNRTCVGCCLVAATMPEPRSITLARTAPPWFRVVHHSPGHWGKHRTRPQAHRSVNPNCIEPPNSTAPRISAHITLVLVVGRRRALTFEDWDQQLLVLASAISLAATHLAIRGLLERPNLQALTRSAWTRTLSCACNSSAAWRTMQTR